MKRPRVSIIILNYNGLRFLKECMESVLKQSFQEFEIIFVDNASHDDSIKFMQEWYGKHEKVKIVANKENTGFAEGNNIGVRHAKGTYIVLLNNDTKVHKDWLKFLVEPMEREIWKGRKIMQAMSLAYEPGREKFNHDFYYKKHLTLTMNLCGEIVSIPQTDVNHGGIVNIFYPGGLSVIFRKKEFPQPFEPSYFLYAEDTYLGWLAQLRNGEVVAALRSNLMHYGAGGKNSGKVINKIAVFNGTKNQLTNYLVFYEWKNIIRIAPLFAFTQLAHIIYNPRRFIVKLKAYLWVLLSIRHILAIRKHVQKQRTVNDKELIARMSGKFFDPIYGELLGWSTARERLVSITNSIFLKYCWIVRLKTHELSYRRKAV